MNSDDPGRSKNTPRKGRQKTKEVSGDRKELTLKQRTAVDLYTNPESKQTFGNKVQSVLRAGYTQNYDSARAQAAQLFAKPCVRTEVQRILDERKLGMVDRARVMSEILHKPTVEVAHLDAEGKVTHRTRMSNDKVRLQAIKLLNRMDGTYEHAGMMNRAAQKVLDPLIREWSEKLRKSLEQSSSSSTVYKTIWLC